MKRYIISSGKVLKRRTINGVTFIAALRESKCR
jgi:hypothetical protein